MRAPNRDAATAAAEMELRHSVPGQSYGQRGGGPGMKCLSSRRFRDCSAQVQINPLVRIHRDHEEELQFKSPAQPASPRV